MFFLYLYGHGPFHVVTDSPFYYHIYDTRIQKKYAKSHIW